MRCRGTMARVAETALIPRRHECRDHLPLRAGQGVRSAQQHLRKLEEWRGGLRAVLKGAPNAWNPFRQGNMWHGDAGIVAAARRKLNNAKALPRPPASNL
jgi:hypothetical protein